MRTLQPLPLADIITGKGGRKGKGSKARGKKGTLSVAGAGPSPASAEADAGSAVLSPWRAFGPRPASSIPG